MSKHTSAGLFASLFLILSSLIVTAQPADELPYAVQTRLMAEGWQDYQHVLLFFVTPEAYSSKAYIEHVSTVEKLRKRLRSNKCVFAASMLSAGTIPQARAMASAMLAYDCIPDDGTLTKVLNIPLDEKLHWVLYAPDGRFLDTGALAGPDGQFEFEASMQRLESCAPKLSVTRSVPLSGIATQSYTKLTIGTVIENKLIFADSISVYSLDLESGKCSVLTSLERFSFKDFGVDVKVFHPEFLGVFSHTSDTLVMVLRDGPWKTIICTYSVPNDSVTSIFDMESELRKDALNFSYSTKHYVSYSPQLETLFLATPPVFKPRSTDELRNYSVRSLDVNTRRIGRFSLLLDNIYLENCIPLRQTLAYIHRTRDHLFCVQRFGDSLHCINPRASVDLSDSYLFVDPGTWLHRVVAEDCVDNNSAFNTQLFISEESIESSIGGLQQLGVHGLSVYGWSKENKNAPKERYVMIYSGYELLNHGSAPLPAELQVKTLYPIDRENNGTLMFMSRDKEQKLVLHEVGVTWSVIN